MRDAAVVAGLVSVAGVAYRFLYWPSLRDAKAFLRDVKEESK